MGNVIDGQTDAKDKDKARRKRKATKDDHVQMDPLNLSGIPDQTSKRKRRKKVKDEVVAGHFEEVSAGTVMQDNKSIVQTLVNSDPIVVSNASRLEKPTTT